MMKYAILILSAVALANAQYPGNIEFTPQGYVTYNPGDVYYQQPQQQSHYQPYTYSNPYYPTQQGKKAIVKITGEKVRGNVTFTQAYPDGPVQVEGTLIGLPEGEKGFHVHSLGDITGGCLSSGSHFNPYNLSHGASEDSIRHVGDLGNIYFNNQEVAIISKVDNVISLSGPNSIIGRTLVVHTAVDDLGRTNHKDSKTTGNAGGRAGCGVIGILSEPPVSSASLQSPALLAGLLALLFFYIQV